MKLEARTQLFHDARSAEPRKPASILVSGASALYFPLLRDLVISSAAARQKLGVALGVLDFGMPPEALDWLHAQHAVIVSVDAIRAALPAPRQRAEFLPYVTRPLLADFFPSYRSIIWFDADTWFQRPDALDPFVNDTPTLTIVAERHPGYRFQAWLQAWMIKHFVTGYGLVRGLRLHLRPHLNVGAFALAADSPLWPLWKSLYTRAFERTGRALPHDQFALIQAVYQFAQPACIVPAAWNWIADRGPPVWNDALGCFCTPDPRHEPIRIMALAGPAKRATYRVPRIDGGHIETTLHYQAYERLRASA